MGGERSTRGEGCGRSEAERADFERKATRLDEEKRP